MSQIPVAVQLYTLRDLTAKDFAGTIAQVARIGYRHVELAGYGNLKTAKEVRKALDDHGVKAVANHSGIDGLETNLNQVLDDNDALGNKNIVVPYLADTRRKNAADWKSVAQSMDKFGAEVQKRGFTLGYHNHSFEFQKFDGKTGWDLIWENSDPKNLKAEVDVYWCQHGEHDPVQVLNKLGSRVFLIHLKDMAAGPDKKFAEVGTGILNFKSILETGNKIGVKAYIVEQDSTYGADPLKAITTSYENLKKLGAV